MSKILGRVNDVLNVSKELKEADIPKYIKDKSKTTWDNIEKVKNDLSIYLPDIAIDFINQDKIYMYKSPLRIYTFTSIPEYEDERRFIRYPSLTPKKEFEREYSFFLGLLLSSYHMDTQEEIMEIGKEYDDILPLLLDYLYMKQNNKEDKYALKFLNFIDKFLKRYQKSYKKYDEFCDTLFNTDTYEFNDDELEHFENHCKETESEFEEYTMNKLIKLSSLDGMLQIIDKNYDEKEFKKLIEELVINEDFSRTAILYDKGIESYGYKRLRKEIEKYKK